MPLDANRSRSSTDTRKVSTTASFETLSSAISCMVYFDDEASLSGTPEIAPVDESTKKPGGLFLKMKRTSLSRPVRPVTWVNLMPLTNGLYVVPTRTFSTLSWLAFITGCTSAPARSKAWIANVFWTQDPSELRVASRSSCPSSHSVCSKHAVDDRCARSVLYVPSAHSRHCSASHVASRSVAI